jgi:hypothetical protein
MAMGAWSVARARGIAPRRQSGYAPASAAPPPSFPGRLAATAVVALVPARVRVERNLDPTGPATGSPQHGYARMFKGFCQGARRHPEFLQCTKRHARAPFLTAAISFRCVKNVTAE